MKWQQSKRWIGAGAAGVVMALALTAGPHASAAYEPEQIKSGETKGAAPFGVTATMRIDGLNGNTATPIVSFSLGATNSAGDGGGGAGKVVFSSLSVAKTLDADSVPLLQAAATGQVLKTVAIQVFAGNSLTPFATYTFEDVTVTSTVFGSSPTSVDEQDQFDFRRITSDVTVNGQSFHSCFDIKTFTPCA
jgi:type VI protein secretion system component Hcp